MEHDRLYQIHIKKILSELTAPNPLLEILKKNAPPPSKPLPRWKRAWLEVVDRITNAVKALKGGDDD